MQHCIITHFTRPILDTIARLSYDIIHYESLFVLAALFQLFRPPTPVFAKAFGHQNCIGAFA